MGSSGFFKVTQVDTRIQAISISNQRCARGPGYAIRQAGKKNAYKWINNRKTNKQTKNTQTIPEEEKLKWPKNIQKDFQSHY